jgi:hypothetical protein
MSKDNKPEKPSPADLISKAEGDIARLEQKRQLLAQRAGEHAQARERLSYRAHVQQDVSASRELSEARETALRAEQELGEIDSALATARGKLAEARKAQAGEERRAAIKQLQQRSKEFRELGPFLDKAVDNLRRGAIALKENASAVGRDWRHVATLYRVLSVALAGTPFREVLPVADSNDRRTFANFTDVLNGWCDSHDASLARELAALGGEAEQTKEKAEANAA